MLYILYIYNIIYIWLQYFRWTDRKSPLSPIPYSAINSRVIPSLAYVTSKRRCRNMGRTRAIRIERCFWGTVDEQALNRAVFGNRGGEGVHRHSSTFRFCIECRWYIRMLPLSKKKATFMTHELRFSRLLIFHLHGESSIVSSIRFDSHLLLTVSIKRVILRSNTQMEQLTINYWNMFVNVLETTIKMTIYIWKIRAINNELPD